jgi:hypothetical protein
MTRSLRNTLVATLVALHTAVAVGGAGLHALPGWGHGSELKRLATDDHSHGPGKSSHEAAEDCQVCQFLTLGQIASGPATAAPVWLSARVERPRAETPSSVPARSPSVPRAPPTPA